MTYDCRCECIPSSQVQPVLLNERMNVCESVLLATGGAVRERAWLAWTQILQLMEDEDDEVSCMLSHAAARAPAAHCALIQPCARMRTQ